MVYSFLVFLLLLLLRLYGSSPHPAVQREQRWEQPQNDHAPRDLTLFHEHLFLSSSLPPFLTLPVFALWPLPAAVQTKQLVTSRGGQQLAKTTARQDSWPRRGVVTNGGFVMRSPFSHADRVRHLQGANPIYDTMTLSRGGCVRAQQHACS
jgi:hypothetical protein